MTYTRPDICWIITKLSQYLSTPSITLGGSQICIKEYIRGTLDYELCYKKCNDGLVGIVMLTGHHVHMIDVVLVFIFFQLNKERGH